MHASYHNLHFVNLNLQSTQLRVNTGLKNVIDSKKKIENSPNPSQNNCLFQSKTIKDNSTPSQRVITSSLALNREQRKRLNFNCNLSYSISLWRPSITRKRYQPECQLTAFALLYLSTRQGDPTVLLDKVFLF